jgi:acetyltransferase
MTSELTSFFSPHGVALIGASANPNKLSNAILRNLINTYQGPIYPVNPRYQEMAGLPCYPDIADVPDPVELAVSILAAKMTPAMVEACGRRGIKAATIISSGFKEVGREGAALEEECVVIARRYGMRLMGPNGIGVIDLNTGLNTTFLRSLPERGHIAFVSQSGAICGGVVDYITGKHVGFSHFVSLGNEADITETDIIAYLGEDSNVRVIALYVEAITDGRRFMETVRKVTRQKPVVLLKAGRTDAGDRAALSHTGSLVGSLEAYHAAFRQSGVIEAFSVSELFDIAHALACQPLPAGNRVAVLTNAGGPAVLASDSLSTCGMRLEELTQQTKAYLHERLHPSAQVSNPVDMLGGADHLDYAFALRGILSDSTVDAALTILVPQALINPADVAAKICEVAKNAVKPIVTCFMGDMSIGQARQILHQHSVPMYVFPEAAGRVLGAMRQYGRWRNRGRLEAAVQVNVDVEAARRILAVEADQILGEAQTRPVFEAYGIPVISGDLARSPKEAVKIADQLGYPVVLKIVSPDILHKSDAGGIRLNLADSAAVTTAYRQLMDKVATAHPEARIEGVLVEAMAPQGYEVIVGMRRDPQFGPLMMFGLGGIYVELLTDVAFRVAPVNRREALAMIRETRAGRLLSGIRGRQAADLETVVDCIVRLSQLALDFPQIEEAEVNPLLVLPQDQGAVALDGRAVLSAVPKK